MERWSSWLNRTLAIGSTGACAALVMWGPARMVTAALPVVFVVALAQMIHRLERPTGTTVLDACVATLRISASATSLLLSLYVVASVHAAWGLLLVVGVAVSTPPVREAALCRTHLLRTSSQPDGDPPERTAHDAQHLTDTELRHAWHHTSRALSAASHPGRRLALVITRQHLLDEMWVRDRVALEAWVACGARADDRSLRYFDPQ